MSHKTLRERRTLRGFGLVALLALALGASGCAVMKTPYSRDGFYVGASMIGTVANFDDIGAIDLGDSELVAGIGIRGGYRFFDRFAFEVAYEGNDEFEFDSGADVSIQSFTVQGKFFPLTGRIQPYGLVGVGLLDADVTLTTVDEAEFLGRLGIGIEGYLTRSVPVFFEIDYNIPSSDLDELQYSAFQLGVMYRF